MALAPILWVVLYGSLGASIFAWAAALVGVAWAGSWLLPAGGIETAANG